MLCRPSACPSRCRDPCWASWSPPYAALAPTGSAQADSCELIMQRPPQARRCSRWNAAVCSLMWEPRMRKVPNLWFLWAKLSLILRGTQGARHGGCEEQALRSSRRLRDAIFLRVSWQYKRSRQMFRSQGARHDGHDQLSLRPSRWLHKAIFLRLPWQQSRKQMFHPQGARHGGCDEQALRPSIWLHEAA